MSKTDNTKIAKNYMLDTNILLSNPNAIFGFEDNNVWLCGTVIQELDKHKDDEGEVGFNARESLRLIRDLIIDALEGVNVDNRTEVVKQGIKLPNGGKLCFEPDGVSADNLPNGYSLQSGDNRIISSCVHLNNEPLKDNSITLLTNDGGCFVNAILCGVNSDSVKHEEVKQSTYSGHLETEIKNYKMIQKIYKDGQIDASKITELRKLKYPLFENQFVTLNSGTMSVLTVHQHGILYKIPDMTVHGDIKHLNKMQNYAMWALTNPDIPLVILEGPAGTAKTFVSLACGLDQLGISDARAEGEIYDRILISRPNAKTSDDDFGYLPGTLEEKMGPLLASYMDNLEIILGNNDTPIATTRDIISDMMLDGYIELCPLYSIRGRSINNAYLICDEAQNASKKLIKDVITRCGKGTKIIIAGDPSQVDNKFLDKRNNGLVYAKDCMKDSPLCAIIRFDEENCVRSALAEEAIKLMK